MEVRRSVRIVNRQGLHARPCHSIVTTVQTFQSDVRVRSGEREVSGRSILELMTLNAPKGTELEIRVRGIDAQVCAEALVQLFVEGFGE